MVRQWCFGSLGPTPGWLLLGEMLQIQWSPTKTEVADGRQQLTVADDGELAEKSG